MKAHYASRPTASFCSAAESEKRQLQGVIEGLRRDVAALQVPELAGSQCGDIRAHMGLYPYYRSLITPQLLTLPLLHPYIRPTPPCSVTWLGGTRQSPRRRSASWS